ncbi:MAG TPA: hypothetical protein VG406_26435, partial [Isosphaeraceae bacterium]|nr:hypothetical protein [Isosphaeraceae bacterium]
MNHPSRKRRPRARGRGYAAGFDRLESRRVLSLNYGNAFALGATDVQAGAVAVDAVGDTYLAGTFSGTVNFNPSGTADLTSAGGRDMFVVKYSPGGSVLWAKDFGGTGDDLANALVVDAQGNVDVAGQFQGTAHFGGTTLTGAGSGNSAVVFRLDPSTGNVLWAKSGTSTGSGNDAAISLAADAVGNVFVTGQFQGTASFGSGAAFSITSSGTTSAFLAKYAANGTPQWVNSFGSTGTNIALGNGVAVDGQGNAIVVGGFSGTATYASPGGHNVNLGGVGTPQISHGSLDIWVARFSTAGDLTLARAFGGTIADLARAVAADAAGNIYVTGIYEGTVAFGSGITQTSNGGAGVADAFVMKLASSNGITAWVDSFGSIHPETAAGLATDGAGNLYALGQFTGMATSQPAGTSLSAFGANNADYLLRISPNGSIFDAVAAGSSASNVVPAALAVNASGTVATAGSFTTSGGGPTFGTTTLSSKGTTNVFVAERKAIRGDYTATGTAQLVVFQPSTASFSVQGVGIFPFGQGTLYGGNPIPIAGSYSTPGVTDVAVFQPSTSTFYIAGVGAIPFGQGTLYGGDPIPVVADFTGSGKAQLAVFQPSTSTFYIQGVGAVPFGQGTLYGGDPIPVVGDYTGSGKAQLAVFQPSTSTFYIAGVGAIPFGQGTL